MRISKDFLDELPPKYQVDLSEYIYPRNERRINLHSSLRGFIVTLINNDVRSVFNEPESARYHFVYKEKIPEEIIMAIKKAKPIIREDNNDII